jgi:dolichyl-diphosphooligosaccharide--protein glycosyltransferase
LGNVGIMSDENAGGGTDPGGRSPLDTLERYYQVPVLALVLAFMLWVRTRSAERFFRDGQIYFSGNDPWYHFRQVVYTVENFPKVMPFDPWTAFPTGTSVGQFGTLFDQLIAAAALVVGLGDPSQTTVATTVLYAPAVFGTLVAVPTYLIARRLWNRPAGLFAAVTLALLPGVFLTRGLVGTADHNIAEPLFQAFAVLGLMAALAVARRERPVWEQFLEGDRSGLRRVVGWSALSGVATALYLWTWPPGVLIVGVFGIFFALLLSVQYLRGESPEHAAIAGTISLSVTALLALVPLSTVAFSPVQPSLVQPSLAALVAVGCVFMAWLARQWDARDLSRTLYPLTVLGLIAVGTGLTALLLPDVFSTITRNLQRFVGFGVTGGTATIGEAQPTPRTFGAVFNQYGLTFFVAVAAGLVALFRFARDRADPSELLLVVWFAFITAAAFTQVRFNYYLAVPVAVFNGYALGWVTERSFFGDLSLRDVDGTQVMTVLVLFLVVLAPLVAPVTVGNTTKDTAMTVGNNTGPGGVLGWDDSLEYMDEELPEQGNFDNAGNAEELPKYGTYEKTDDFDYPEGAYGVMSWWDYGHWMTTLGDTIPVANPFQQNADVAANYLLAPDEATANEVLEGINEDDAKTRYVAVDWQMISAGEKLSAPTAFYDNGNLSSDDIVRPLYVQSEGGVSFDRYVFSQRYYESTMVRLYRYHGSARQAGGGGGPVTVVDWDGAAETRAGTEALIARSGNTTREFESLSAARQYVNRDTPNGTAQIGGISGAPPEYVPAMEHYRMVKASERIGGAQTVIPSYVKVFERVPGATIEGQGPANTTVTAQVQMEAPSAPTIFGNQFVYTQRAQTGPDGSFTMTLPYSTTGYENWGTDEGYANVSVRANSTYRLNTGVYSGGLNGATPSVATANVSVPEAKVLGEDTSPIEVEMDTQPLVNRSGSGDDANASAALAEPGVRAE